MDDIKRSSGCGWFFWVFLAAIITFLTIRSTYIHHTSPEYVLNVAAQPYVDDVETFFNANLDQIAQLETLYQSTNSLEPSTNFFYAFFPLESHPNNVSAELEKILKGMVVTENNTYIFYLNEGEMGFVIRDNSWFIVTLLYDSPDHYWEGSYERQERWIDLDNHWAIRIEYRVPP